MHYDYVGSLYPFFSVKYSLLSFDNLVHCLGGFHETEIIFVNRFRCFISQD